MQPSKKTVMLFDCVTVLQYDRLTVIQFDRMTVPPYYRIMRRSSSSCMSLRPSKIQ